MGKPVMLHVILFGTFLILAKGQVVLFPVDFSENIKDSATVTKEWNKMENELQDFVKNGMKMLMPVLVDNMEGTNISSTCIKQALQVIGGIRRLQPWAIRFLDSSAKGMNGGIVATFNSFGDYDECIDTVAINQHSGKYKGEVMFTGKYCILRIKPRLPPWNQLGRSNYVIEELREFVESDTIVSKLAEQALFFYHFSLQLGLCVPSGCTVDDINEMFAKVTSATGLFMKVRRCEVKEETKFTPLMIFVMCVYSFFGLTVFLATLTDAYYYYSSKQKPNNKSAGILFAFSMLSNFQKLIDTSTSHKNLSALNGIRFFSMSWIIAAHSYMVFLLQLGSGMEYLREQVRGFAMQAMTNGAVAVQTFFFLGGFLLCFNATNDVNIAHKRLNLKLYALQRLWRILPLYTFVILSTFLLPLISSGPMAYGTTQIYAEGCKKEWWGKLLFISNFLNGSDICVSHGWYLTVDMQLYLGALIILLPLFRWPKIGVSIAIACSAGFMITTGALTYMNDHPPTGLLGKPDVEEVERYVKHIYHMPYPHVSSYVIGIMVGYLVAMHPKLKIPMIVQLICWPIAILLSMSALYGTYEWYGDKDATVMERIFYSSCHRTAWTVGLAWLVICCSTGHGGVINYILSWEIWIPLGRLTFAAYLIHLFVQLAFTGHTKRAMALKNVLVVWLFFGHLVVTYGTAFVASMLIEFPFQSLGKIIFFQRDNNSLKNKKTNAPSQTADKTEVISEKDMDNFQKSNVPQEYKGEDNEGFVYRL